MRPISPISSAPPVDDRVLAARAPAAAMVFAAGRGVRMRPLTDRIPKPLVAVGGRTLLDRALDGFAEAGVETAVVNVHHLADQIEAHLASRARPRIAISDERARLLDQGGGIKKALPLLGDRPFFVCNTDAFWIGPEIDNLARLVKLWDADEMDAALLLAPTIGSVGVDWNGDFDRNRDGRITRRSSENDKPFVYAGVGVIKPELFSGVEDEVFGLAPFLFSAAERGRLFGVVGEGLWCHVGTIAAIDEAERAARAAM